MKGVKYLLEFKKPNNEIETIIADMKDLIMNIKSLTKEHYFIDVEMSNYIVYNLYKKRGGSKILKNICNIEKI